MMMLRTMTIVMTMMTMMTKSSTTMIMLMIIQREHMAVIRMSDEQETAMVPGREAAMDPG